MDLGDGAWCPPTTGLASRPVLIACAPRLGPPSTTFVRPFPTPLSALCLSLGPGARPLRAHFPEPGKRRSLACRGAVAVHPPELARVKLQDVGSARKLDEVSGQQTGAWLLHHREGLHSIALQLEVRRSSAPAAVDECSLCVGLAAILGRGQVKLAVG